MGFRLCYLLNNDGRQSEGRQIASAARKANQRGSRQRRTTTRGLGRVQQAEIQVHQIRPPEVVRRLFGILVTN